MAKSTRIVVAVEPENNALRIDVDAGPLEITVVTPSAASKTYQLITGDTFELKFPVKEQS